MRLKVRTSNMTSMFPGTVQTDPLKILPKRGANFLALNANCPTTVKDTDFIFDKHVPWDEKLLRGLVRNVPRNVLVKFEVRNFDRSRTMFCHLMPKNFGVMCPWQRPLFDKILRGTYVYCPREHACQIRSAYHIEAIRI